MENAFILLGFIGFQNLSEKMHPLKLNKNYKFSLVIIFTFMASFSSARDFGEDALYRFLSIIMEACLNIETCTMYIVHCSCTGVYP